MDELRSAYYTGNFSRAQALGRSLLLPDSGDFAEAMSLFWKSACISGVSGAEVIAAISSASGNNNASASLALLKTSLMHWTRAVSEKGKGGTNVNGNLFGNFMQVGEQAAALDMSVAERDWILQVVVEGLMVLQRDEDAFCILKQMKASNLNGQLMFVEMLLIRGQVGAAEDRLRLLKQVPEFAEDVRLLMVEAGVKLAREDEDAGERHSGVRDALYTYQELAQLHGRSDQLAQGQAAALALLGKFSEARALLTGLSENTVALDAALNAPDFNQQLKSFALKHPDRVLL